MYDKFEQQKPFALLDTSKYPPEVAGRFNSFITTQFDDSLSVEMQMRSIIKWAIANFKEMDQTYNDFTEYVVQGNLNPFIQFLNDLIEYMNHFIATFDDKYQETILDKMQEWYDNGELESLINESLDTKYHEMDQRVTEQLAQSDGLNNQPSLLNKMKSFTTANSISAIQNGSGVDLFITLDTGNVVKYQFRQNVDNLLLLRGGYASVGKPLDRPTVTLNGSFSGEGAVHTKTIGDSFTFNFTGNGFKFFRPTEQRGGLWRFSIRELGLKKDISCYNITVTANNMSVDVFDNLPFGNYTVKAVYMGEDPSYPNAEARGYIAYSETNPLYYPIEVIRKSREYDSETAVTILPTSTILDFAISARPLNSTSGSVWVPAHAVSNVSINPNIKIYVDGYERSLAVGDGISIDYHDIKSFEISQSFNAINPNDSESAMWRHYITHKISLDSPHVEIFNRLEALQDLQISDMYFTMLAVQTSNFQRFVLSNGKEMDSLPTDGSNLRNEGQIKSVMYAGEYQAGRYHACAVDQESYMESAGLLYKDTNSSPTDSVITFRADNVSKFYVHAYSGVAETGDVFKNTHRIGIVSGIKHPNVLLRSI